MDKLALLWHRSHGPCSPPALLFSCSEPSRSSVASEGSEASPSFQPSAVPRSAATGSLKLLRLSARTQAACALCCSSLFMEGTMSSQRSHWLCCGRSGPQPVPGGNSWEYDIEHVREVTASAHCNHHLLVLLGGLFDPYSICLVRRLLSLPTEACPRPVPHEPTRLTPFAPLVPLAPPIAPTAVLRPALSTRSQHPSTARPDSATSASSR